MTQNDFRALAGALLVVVSSWAPACVRAQPLSALQEAAPSSLLTPVERPDDDLLVLELRLDGRVVSREISGYLHRRGVLLPLQETVKALELSITVDPAEGKAEGWFLQENRRFSLDLARREVTVEGRRGSFDPERVELHAEDLYVETSLLDEWFPIRTKVDLSQLAVLIEAREKLPLQLRLERRAKWKRLRREAGAGKPGYPETKVPYRLLDWPILDGTLTASYRPDQTGGRREALRNEALVTGDLLAMTAELYVQNMSGAESELGEEAPNRFKLGRKDPGAHLLGPLRAREFELGSLFTPERPLLSSAQAARGLVVSNFTVSQVEEHERTTLHGNALPGWEVELYQNESLIDFQVVDQEGRYVFAGVPLLFGMNLFRIVFYGPQGQQRQELRRVLIGDEMIPRAETRYRFAAGELESDLVRDPPQVETRESDRTLYSLDLRRGFSEGLSASLGVDSLRLRRERHTYLGLGLRRGKGGVFSRLDLIADSAGGWAGRAAVQSRWRSFGVLAQMDRYEGFVSGQVPASLDPPRARALLRLDGTAGGRVFRSSSFNLAMEGGERQSGALGLRLSGRVTGQLSRVTVGHRLDMGLNRQRDGRFENPDVEGAFLASGRWRWGSLRGELGYRLEPTRTLEDLLLTGDRDLGRGRSLRLGMRRTVSPQPGTRTFAGMSWQLRQVLLGMSLSYDTGTNLGILGGTVGAGSGLSADLTLAYSLRREPLSGRWHMSSRRSATEGAAAARVFLDQDRDGRFSPGDEPLPGVRFSAEGGGSLRGRTDERGIALLPDLPLYRPVDVGIALGSLEDPAWVPQRDGFGVTLRPGVTPAVELPVVASGEIEGTAYLRAQGRTVPVAGVQLQLVDLQGAVRREARSAYDGFYLFERVPPGRYRVRVAPEQLQRRGLKPVPQREVEIGLQGEVIRGIDLHLERAEEAAGGPPGEGNGR